MKVLISSILCFVLTGNANKINQQQNALSEKQKIEMLINYVSELKGAVFIRNGEQHTPTEAAKHLRLKLSKAGSKIKTAMDFIEICASKSSATGSKYTIKTADGKERPSKEILVEQLKVIEKNRG